MTKADILTAARDFIAFIEDDPMTAEDGELKLSMLLDQLALAYHFSIHSFDKEKHGKPPEKGHEVLRKKVQKRFPDFGFYNIPANIDPKAPDPELVIEDSIDDIVDITLDMKEFTWRWEHTSELEALWYFRFSYDVHWGKHLRTLQLYLLDRQS